MLTDNLFIHDYKAHIRNYLTVLRVKRTHFPAGYLTIFNRMKTNEASYYRVLKYMIKIFSENERLYHPEKAGLLLTLYRYDGIEKPERKKAVREKLENILNNRIRDDQSIELLTQYYFRFTVMNDPYCYMPINNDIDFFDFEPFRDGLVTGTLALTNLLDYDKVKEYKRASEITHSCFYNFFVVPDPVAEAVTKELIKLRPPAGPLGLLQGFMFRFTLKERILVRIHAW